MTFQCFWCRMPKAKWKVWGDQCHGPYLRSSIDRSTVLTWVNNNWHVNDVTLWIWCELSRKIETGNCVAPRGFGSLCPEMDAESMQELRLEGLFRHFDPRASGIVDFEGLVLDGFSRIFAPCDLSDCELQPMARKALSVAWASWQPPAIRKRLWIRPSASEIRWNAMQLQCRLTMLTFVHARTEVSNMCAWLCFPMLFQVSPSLFVLSEQRHWNPVGRKSCMGSKPSSDLSKFSQSLRVWLQMIAAWLILVQGSDCTDCASCTKSVRKRPPAKHNNGMYMDV